ncbi:MAG: amino acid permease [Anaerolineales bacterium]|nr:amino acid permease [Anaerolineales bacterium]MCB9128150.1 amino acid permease [Ardenticatenales bacterium]MCB9171860.1 amino acid permease [Ardenticatenales bacterium]
METHSDLHRELGFWDALTIGAGTMIGAGIFLLAGKALAQAGPAAIFSYIGAGIVCIITAASAAELATGMPTSGGDYFFVSRSLGPAFGAISGVGIWLSLTFAIAFYLFGLGEFLHQLIGALPPLAGSLIGGVLLLLLNVVGAKESGRTQVVVVLLLLAVLTGFSLLGVFNIEWNNFTPFLPYGSDPIFPTMSLVFISFLGFVKIAAVAEEIKEPSRNLPRALIGSVALVTALYVLIVLVVAGIFPQNVIATVPDPLTRAAREMMGPVGATIILFAGLLATLSSANASIMASSRINLAMARDRMIPNWLAAIHDKFLTPYRAIVVTGILALSFLAIDSLEELAEIAGVLQLYSYGALNIGCIVLRASSPDWYKPTYRTPGYPFAQLFAAVACIGIIISAGPIAQAMVVGLILLSLGWYVVWGRSRVDIVHAMPVLRDKLAQFGPRAFFMPAPRYGPDAEELYIPPERPLDPTLPRRVTVALANPQHESALLHLGQYIATGAEQGGEVFGIHFERVPLSLPLSIARDRFHRHKSAERTIQRVMADAVREQAQEGVTRPLQATEVVAVTDVAHDVFAGILGETHQRHADLLLMGWQGELSVAQIYNSPVQSIMSDLHADLAVLKSRDLTTIRRILLPWGGGAHARLGLEIAARIADATGAVIEVLRVVKANVDEVREARTLRETVARITRNYPDVEFLVRQDDNVIDGIQAQIQAQNYDLLIIGASRESTLRRVLFGSIPDIVADNANCSVLMVRRYQPEHWTTTVGDRVKTLRESAGLTTSPEARDERVG